MEPELPEKEHFWSIKVNPGYILSFVIVYGIIGGVVLYGEFQALKESVGVIKQEMHEIQQELRGRK